MKRLILAGALALAAASPAMAAPALPAGVTETSYTAADGSRALRESIDIAAPPATVWRLFTDPGAIKATGVANAWVELKNGGFLEESLSPQAGPGDANNIRHEIIVFVPDHLMVLRNQNTPAGLPGREAFKRIVQVVEIDDLSGGHSRLTLTGAGYGSGAEFDGLYGFFHDHNGDLLTGLKAVAEKLAKGG